MLSLCTQTVQMVLLEGMFDIRHFLLNIPWTLIGAASVLLWRLLAKKNKPVRYIIRGIMILLALILLAGIVLLEFIMSCVSVVSSMQRIISVRWRTGYRPMIQD